MFASADDLRFDKDLPGATLTFQPNSLDGYADDPWDVRITIGDAPLEDAFYFTVREPGDVRCGIGELLDRYALNLERRAELDIDSYPELPALQDELVQYYGQVRAGRLQLRVYVNKNPTAAPVDLAEPAAEYLSVCTFDDGSYDYRVLDLVFVLQPPDARDFDVRRLRDQYGPPFLLFLFDHHRAAGDEAFATLLKGQPFAGYVEQRFRSDDSFPAVTDQMKRLELSACIRRAPDKDAPLPFGLTEKGARQLQQLRAEAQELVARYERYRSVWLIPPALGVPDGFDLRLQLMEEDGCDLLRALFLWSLHADADALFADGWAEAFQAGQLFRRIYGALAFRTAFSADRVREVRALGKAFDEAAGL